MKYSAKDDFLQPVVSTIGLAVSVISSLFPIFSKDPVRSLFINEQLAFPAAFFAFVFGGAVIWMVSEHYKYFEINIGKLKDRGRGFLEPWKKVTKKEIILIFLVLDLLLAFSFFLIKETSNPNSPNAVSGIVQAFLYISFFIILMAVFAFLVTSTMGRMKYENERENIPWTILNSLERTGLVNSGIELYNNRFLTNKEREELNVTAFGQVRKIRVKTKPQEEEVVEVVMTDDYKEILKVLRKGK